MSEYKEKYRDLYADVQQIWDRQSDDPDLAYREPAEDGYSYEDDDEDEIFVPYIDEYPDDDDEMGEPLSELERHEYWANVLRWEL